MGHVQQLPGLAAPACATQLDAPQGPAQQLPEVERVLWQLQLAPD